MAMSSSRSASFSMSVSRAASAVARSGTSGSSSWLIGSSRSQTNARISSRSTIPANVPSAPIGSWIGTMWSPKRSLSEVTARSKSAPMRSSLFTNAMRGTSYLSACRHTVSVCGSTPATPSSTAMAPSSTRSERSTSMVKSTCPGVSMRCIS